MALFLSETHIEELVDAKTINNSVAEVSLAQANQEVHQLPRQRLRMSSGMLHQMSATWAKRGYYCLKAYSSSGGTIRFRIFLYSAKTGEMLSILEGNRLGQLRTGAATAIAARYLARSDSHVLALFGTGLQAWGQLESLVADGFSGDVRVYSRDPERRNSFAERAEGAFALPIVAVEDASSCVDKADIVITATTSRTAVFDGKLLPPGSFVAAVGANMLIKRELDGQALRRIDRYIVDDRDTAQRESGMLMSAVEAGRLYWSSLQTLPELVGTGLGARENDAETICFHSLGSAAWDLAAAIETYERAKAQGIGDILPLD